MILCKGDTANRMCNNYFISLLQQNREVRHNCIMKNTAKEGMVEMRVTGNQPITKHNQVQWVQYRYKEQQMVAIWYILVIPLLCNCSTAISMHAH